MFNDKIQINSRSHPFWHSHHVRISHSDIFSRFFSHPHVTDVAAFTSTRLGHVPSPVCWWLMVIHSDITSTPKWFLKIIREYLIYGNWKYYLVLRELSISGKEPPPPSTGRNLHTLSLLPLLLVLGHDPCPRGRPITNSTFLLRQSPYWRVEAMRRRRNIWMCCFMNL